MATSGTVGATRYPVAKLVDKAFRRVGKNPSTVSGELRESALESLGLVCIGLSNRGVNLFTVRKNVLPVKANSAAYAMAVGTDEVLNVLYRTLTLHTGTPLVDVDSAGISFLTPVAITNVQGVFPTAGAAELVVEYNLGAGWISLITYGLTSVDAGADFVLDIPNSVLASSWRVRDASGNATPMTGVLFRTIANELNMSQLNRDDYVNLPNKFQIGGKSLQYWYDKQLDPVIYVWPVSNQVLDQIVIYTNGQVEDVGSMSNDLAVPARWYEAIIFMLAEKLCLEIPPAELPPGRFEMIAASSAKAQIEADGNESDGSSYRLSPSIRNYTRF